jgi:hypothetical protein
MVGDIIADSRATSPGIRTDADSLTLRVDHLTVAGDQMQYSSWRSMSAVT